MNTTSPFDATLLAAHEVRDVTQALQFLDELDSRLNDCIMLGEIPVLDEDGTETIGYLKQGDDYQWRFIAAYSTATQTPHFPALPPPVREQHPDSHYPDGGDCA